MPVYEYACDSCHERFEIKQKFTDDPLSICPRCSGSLHRVIQPTRIVFKGSGFYVTDHGKNNTNGHASTNQTKPTPESGDTKPTAGDSPAATTKASATETAKTEAPATT